MANPPIVIGPFDNVPAPGSPIRSNWPQEITQYVLDQLAAVRAEFAAADNSAAARRPVTFMLSGGAFPIPANGVWSNIQFGIVTLPFAGEYVMRVAATLWPGAAGGTVAMSAGFDGVQQTQTPGGQVDCPAGSSAHLTAEVVLQVPTAGARTLSMFAWTNSASGGSTDTRRASITLNHPTT